MGKKADRILSNMQNAQKTLWKSFPRGGFF
jgi:hypothetical protein